MAGASWYMNGALLYLTPSGLNQYESQSSSLLSTRFGAGVPAPLLIAETTGHVVFGGDEQPPILLRPQQFTITPLEQASGIRIGLDFQAIRTVVELHGVGEGCTMTVQVDPIRIDADLEAGRDIAGHISVLAKQTSLSASLGTPAAVLSNDCHLSPDLAQSTRSQITAAIHETVETTLTDPLGIIATLESMVEVLIGADVVRHLTVHDSTLSATGRFDLTLVPNSEDGSEPIVVTSNEALVTSLRIGIESTAGACSTSWNLPDPVPPPGSPPPSLDTQNIDSDVMIALRLDVLDHILRGVAKSGALCQLSTPTTPLGAIRPYLPETLPMPFPDETLSWLRVQLKAAPLFDWAENTPTPQIKLTIPAVHVEVYVKAWGSDWLVHSQEDMLEIPDLVPTLEDSWVRLQRPDTAVSDTHSSLTWFGLEQATQGWPLFALPAIYPYPLVDAAFERQDNHLIMNAHFATDHAPQMEGIASPLRIDHPPPHEAAGCGMSQGKPAPIPIGAWILGCMLMAAFLRKRRTQ